MSTLPSTSTGAVETPATPVGVVAPKGPSASLLPSSASVASKSRTSPASKPSGHADNHTETRAQPVIITNNSTPALRQAGPNRSSKNRYEEFHQKTLSAQKSELRAVESSSLYTAAAAAVSARRLADMAAASSTSLASRPSATNTKNTIPIPVNRRASTVSISSMTSTSTLDSLASTSTSSNRKPSFTTPSNPKKKPLKEEKVEKSNADKPECTTSGDNKQAPLLPSTSDTAKVSSLAAAQKSIHTVPTIVMERSPSKVLNKTAKNLAKVAATIEATKEQVKGAKAKVAAAEAAKDVKAKANAAFEAQKEASKENKTKATAANEAQKEASKEIKAKAALVAEAHREGKEVKAKVIESKPKATQSEVKAKPVQESKANPQEVKAKRPESKEIKPKLVQEAKKPVQVDVKEKAKSAPEAKDLKAKSEPKDKPKPIPLEKAKLSPQSKAVDTKDVKPDKSKPPKEVKTLPPVDLEKEPKVTRPKSKVEPSQTPSIPDSKTAALLAVRPPALYANPILQRSISPSRREDPMSSNENAQVLSPIPRRTGALSTIPLLQHQRGSSEASTIKPSLDVVLHQLPARRNSVSPVRPQSSARPSSRTALAVPRTGKTRPLSTDSMKSVTSSSSDVYTSTDSDAIRYSPKLKPKQTPPATHFQSTVPTNGTYIYHPPATSSHSGFARTTMRDKRSKTSIGFINPFHVYEASRKSFENPSSPSLPGTPASTAQLTAAQLAGGVVDSKSPPPTVKDPMPPPGPSSHHRSFLGRVKQKLKINAPKDTASGATGNPQQPEPQVLIKTTMRKQNHKKSFNEDKPWKHHIDAVKLTEHERKRYEGIWAANRGIHVPFLYPMDGDNEDDYDDVDADEDDDDPEEDEYDEYDDESDESDPDSDMESMLEESDKGSSEDKAEFKEPKLPIVEEEALGESHPRRSLQSVRVEHVVRRSMESERTSTSIKHGQWQNGSSASLPQHHSNAIDTKSSAGVSSGPSARPATTVSEDYDQTQNIHGVVVRELWRRSRLGDGILENIWDLVDRVHDGCLDREGFLVGMWLVDQCLYGRKLPVKVDDTIWRSVGRLNVRIKIRRSKKEKEERKAEQRHLKKQMKKQKKAMSKMKDRAVS